STVLLVQDVLPWGSDATQRVLAANHLFYDVATTAQIGTMELSGYRSIIISSDQPTSTYSQLAGLMPQLSAYVSSGGVLEIHASGWGWNSGDASIVPWPGGLRVEHWVSSYWNYSVKPDHPLLAGMQYPISGYPNASLAHFITIPPGATIITTDESYRPSLVEY